MELCLYDKNVMCNDCGDCCDIFLEEKTFKKIEQQCKKE